MSKGYIKGNIRDSIKELVYLSVKSQFEIDINKNDIEILVPNNKDNGDFSTNIAMKLAGQLRRAPQIIADDIIDEIENNIEKTHIDKVEKAGPGFINFYLGTEYLYKGIQRILDEKENYANLNIGKGKKVLVEYVSANPTGPLHMGNARGGALGDLIASVLKKAGYDVTKEFYVNDAGNQIIKFGVSLEARYIQLLKGEDAIDFPEDGYHGEDITENAKKYISIYGENLLEEDEETRREKLAKFALEENLKHIKESLSKYGIEFDNWYRESTLFENNKIDKTLELLKDKELLYNKEDATWFKTTKFGSDKDDVLIRSNGVSTYFTSDIAYHKDKFIDRGFDRCIDLLGADHHGHVNRMKAACEAIGVEKEKLEIIVFQLVRLMRNGEVARMSKRTGKAISLDDLIDEVGRDAVRFFFNMKASGSHLDFDLELAKKQSNENPVFYVQYAYARICSLMKKIQSEDIEVSDYDLKQLKAKEEISLMEKLLEYPNEIRLSAQSLEPSRLTRYAKDLASQFHAFYNSCRIIGEDEKIRDARIKLIEGVKIVLKNLFDLMKISARESM